MHETHIKLRNHLAAFAYIDPENGEELVEAIRFTLDAYADALEHDEPYATKAIAAIRATAGSLDALETYALEALA